MLGGNLHRLGVADGNEQAFYMIEPSCGCGSLLVPALGELASLGVDVGTLIEGRLVICDIDGLALSVCRALVERAFGHAIPDGHVIVGDFLSDGTMARLSATVPLGRTYALMNRPYGSDGGERPGYSVGVGDLYSLFIERCIRLRGMSAIVPQSFIHDGGKVPGVAPGNRHWLLW